MTSWAKNQIAKHLARFAKNIEPSQISLKFLRGEGELSNLELNEQVLTDLLELPPWLQLTKATCNRICAKIHWTSLKTDPIRLYLDCVEVEILASEEARPKAASHVPSHSKSSRERPVAVKATKYGFAEKVVDGMFVSINTVMVNFKASGFKASFSMSRLIIQSTTADWQVPNNLRKTRIKDEQRGQVLIFKEIRWGTMRLDADASYIEASTHGSVPLRLITNNSIVRLTIKKQLNDCSLVSSRLEVILDDILWVLTQSQLLKLSSFIHFILKIRQKFLPLASHSDAQRASPPVHSSAPAQRKSGGQYQGHGSGSNLNPLFTEYDVEETSYHLNTKRIDLHLCDDRTLDGQKHHSSKSGSEANKTSSENGGALLISVRDIRLNHCPYHIAGLRRKVHRADEEARFCRRQWAQQLFDFFLKTEGRQLNQSRDEHGRNSSQSRRPIMHESFFLISCCSFAIMEVTTTDHQEPRPFLSSDKEALFLPADMNALFFDFTTYYFLGNRNLPVPPSNMFVKLNPIQLTFHPLTCVWLNKFVQSVVAGFEWTKEFMARETGPPEHLDLRIETLMPKVTIPYETDPSFPHQEERPKALQAQISQAVISNSRIGAVSSQSDLLMDLQSALASKVYANDSSFPNSKEDMSSLPGEYWVNDYSMVHRSFALAASRQRSPSHASSHVSRAPNDPRLIWCIWCEQLWLDFIGIENSSGRPVTFVDAVPLRFWISLPVLIPKSNKNDCTVISSVENDDAEGRIASPIIANTDGAVHFKNTSSTCSLPGALNSSHTFSTSLSGASSNSSLSVDSPDSEPTVRHSVHGAYGFNAASSQGNAAISRQKTLGGEFAEASENHPLRTSYSESDLLPVENQRQNQNPDSISLQEYRMPQATLPLSDSSGPPPPYYIDSPSSSSPSAERSNARRGSVSSLPPSYGLPPAYDTLNSSEEPSNAPPLPKKVPLAAASQTIKDFLGANSSSNDGAKKVPTIGGLLQIAKPTNVQLDHFQLIFLIRLQEMFAEVMETISVDTERFKQMQSPHHKNFAEHQDAASFSLHLNVPAVDVNLVIPKSNGIEDEQNMSLSDRIKLGKINRIFESLQTQTSLSNEKEMTDASSVSSLESELNKPNKQSAVDQHGSQNNATNSIIETHECIPQTMPSEINVASKPSATSRDLPTLTYATGGQNSIKNDGGISTASAEEPTPADVTESAEQPPLADVTESAEQPPPADATHEPEMSRSQCRLGSVSVLSSNETDDSSGISSTSNSPRSSAPTLDMTGNPDNREPYENSTENGSVHASSSLQTTRVQEHLCAVKSEMSTQTEPEENNAVKDADEDRMVSLVCLKCSGINVGIQTQNDNTLVKINVNEVNLNEKGNIEYNMTLDHRLSSPANNAERDKTDTLVLTNTKPRVMVRLISGPVSESFVEGSKDLGYAHIKVNSLIASLSLSNAENLGEFGEDEFLMPTLPLKIELNDCEFKLLDDKQRRYLSTPLPPPLEVGINSLSVYRSIDGKITIKEGDRLQSPTGDRTLVGDLIDENESNGQSSSGATFDDSKHFLHEKLNVVQDENDRLLQDLKLANARTVSLEEERDAILKVVEKLQQELMWSNNENDKLLDKIRNYRQYLKGLART